MYRIASSTALRSLFLAGFITLAVTACTRRDDPSEATADEQPSPSTERASGEGRAEPLDEATAESGRARPADGVSPDDAQQDPLDRAMDAAEEGGMVVGSDEADAEPVDLDALEADLRALGAEGLALDREDEAACREARRPLVERAYALAALAQRVDPDEGPEVETPVGEKPRGWAIRTAAMHVIMCTTNCLPSGIPTCERIPKIIRESEGDEG